MEKEQIKIKYQLSTILFKALLTSAPLFIAVSLGACLFPFQEDQTRKENYLQQDTVSETCDQHECNSTSDCCARDFCRLAGYAQEADESGAVGYIATCAPRYKNDSFCLNDDECVSAICLDNVCSINQEETFLRNGEACEINQECSSQLCDQGICIEQAVSCVDIYESCGSNGFEEGGSSTCCENLFCKSTGYIDFQCIPQGAENTYCTEDLECLSNLCVDFSCQEASTPGELGSACTTNEECVLDLHCQTISVYNVDYQTCINDLEIGKFCYDNDECTSERCIENKCIGPVETGSLGSACQSEEECLPELHCDFTYSADAYTCIEDLPEGAFCITDNDCQNNSCVNNTCATSLGAFGDECSSSQECDLIFHCEQWSYVNTNTCVEDLAEGNHCLTDDECISSRCNNNDCATESTCFVDLDCDVDQGEYCRSISGNFPPLGLCINGPRAVINEFCFLQSDCIEGVCLNNQCTAL